MDPSRASGRASGATRRRRPDGPRPPRERPHRPVFTVNDGTRAIEVPGSYRNQPFWRDTAVGTLPANGSLSLAPGTLGYEWDSDTEDGLPAAAEQPSGPSTSRRG